jgi:hypothetical protein
MRGVSARALSTVRALINRLAISTAVALIIAGHVQANTAPTAPTRVSVAASHDSALVISWAGARDSDGVIIGYELIRNGSAIWLGNVTSYQDNAVSPGVNYAYNIIAIDNHGWRSAMSDTVVYRFAAQYSQSNNGTTSSAGGSISIGFNTAEKKCVDTDGDGWGWDGEKSCKMSDSTQNNNSAGNTGICIDEDGDGYGWDGYRTCLVNNDSQAVISDNACIDSDGDGYGWDGYKTCVP